MTMQREAFLLRCVAFIFAAQFLIYLAGAASCIYMGLRLQQRVCADFDANLQRTFETALTATLALLGAGRARRD